MLNKVVLMGRLGKDPELRHTPSGTSVASFSLAVERDFKDKETGKRVTDWIDIVAWRQTAEFVNQYFTKGRTAVVDGRLQMRDWTDREGNKRRSAEVVADNVYFVDSRRDGDSGGYQKPEYGSGCSGSYGGSFTPAPSGYPVSDYSDFQVVEDDDNGDIPF